jgi:tripartite-type tricarboxylate transporter receptor subunit TctC
MALAVLASIGTAGAQTWPTRPITLVVPLAAGSTADIVSRLIGNELAKALGQSVVIDNRVGAGGTIAMTQVAKAAPDGYTIAFVSQGTHAINVGLYKTLGYDPVKDFAPITTIASVANIMIVHPSNPAKGPLDVAAAAKGKPGELTFSSGGNGTSHHLSGALFAAMTGVQLTHVPYRGAPQGIQAVMSGEVAMGFFNVPTVIAQIRDGKLKGLAVTSLERSPHMPDLPTLDQSGVKGYDVSAWLGFVAPAGTPAPIIDRLYGEMSKIMRGPELREKMKAQGFDLMAQVTPAEFGRFIASEVEKWVPVVRASGATVD